MSSKIKIKLISPWTRRVETDNAVFDAAIHSSEADALLCEWAPHADLFTFPRRKAWYCCEPWCQFRGLRTGNRRWSNLRNLLRADEFLNHSHPNSQFRVPHITHFEDLAINQNDIRMDRAIAIVSNHGGSPWRRHPGISFRNRFITRPGVDLFGRSGWRHYRAGRFSLRPSAPRNYQGELPGDWPAEGKRELMARYRVAICMENMNEPYYITEKIVEAVSAGCVPVYRSEAGLRDTVLKGAAWIDPVHYDGSPERTMRAAFEVDPDEFRRRNAIWLRGEALAATSQSAVFRRIAAILSST